MTLPDIKNVIKVIFIYKNGKRYYLNGREVKEFFSHLASAFTLAWNHGVKFKKVNWKSEKRLNKEFFSQQKKLKKLKKRLIKNFCGFQKSMMKKS